MSHTLFQLLLLNVSFEIHRSQWLCNLSFMWSFTAQTLGSWVKILLGTCVNIIIFFVLSHGGSPWLKSPEFLFTTTSRTALGPT